MTLEAKNPIITYVYAGPGSYPFNFKVLADTDVKVTHITLEGARVTLQRSVDYTVALDIPNEQGSISMLSLASGGQLQIARVLPIEQMFDWTNNDDFDAEVLEKALDRIVMMLQQVGYQVGTDYVYTNWSGEWVTGGQYAVYDLVSDPISGNWYQCLKAHVAGDLTDDIATGNWFMILDWKAFAMDVFDRMEYILPMPEPTDQGKYPRVQSDGKMAYEDVAIGTSYPRNYILNGMFNVHQQGTSQSNNGILSFDRWNFISTGSLKSVTKVPLVGGDVAAEPKLLSYCQVVVNSVAGAGNLVYLAQVLEGVNRFSGRKITLSFYAKADAVRNIACHASQYFGTGGTPSTDVNILPSTRKFALGTAWTRYTITFDMPSISGKTLGTNGDDGVSIYFWLDAGSNWNISTDNLGQQSGTFSITGIQIDDGDLAQPWEHRSYWTELQMCQRYYYRQVFSGVAAGWATYYAPAIGNSYPLYTFVHPVEMRKVPTATLTGPTLSNCNTVTLTSTKHQTQVSCAVPAIGLYSITGGTLVLDAN